MGWEALRKSAVLTRSSKSTTASSVGASTIVVTKWRGSRCSVLLSASPEDIPSSCSRKNLRHYDGCSSWLDRTQYYSNQWVLVGILGHTNARLHTQNHESHDRLGSCAYWRSYDHNCEHLAALITIPSLARQRCLPSWGLRRTPWFFCNFSTVWCGRLLKLCFLGFWNYNLVIQALLASIFYVYLFQQK